MLDDISGLRCTLFESGVSEAIQELRPEIIHDALSPPHRKTGSFPSTRAKAVSLSRQASVTTVTTAASTPKPELPPVRVLRCYVSIKPQSEFIVRFEETRFFEEDLVVEVLLDGRYVKGRLRKTSHKADFIFCSPKAKWADQDRLVFADLTELEDLLNGEGLGSVCVDVWRGHTERDSDTSVLTTADVEQVLTPRPKGKTPPAFLPEGTAYDPLSNFTFTERIVRFEFRYRTEDWLSHNRIAQERANRSRNARH